MRDFSYFGVEGLIRNALKEDIGTGDVTSVCCVSPESRSKGVFLAKGEGVVCGLDIISMVFDELDKNVSVTPLVKEGEWVNPGDKIAEIEGSSLAILFGERVALNFFQHMCGVATMTRKAVKSVEGTKAKICDTRKTTPGLRSLEKYSVRVGGGVNHRIGLYDGILIKDNHIVAAGGIEKAIRMAREKCSHMFKIEIEITELSQIDEALRAGADVIMLDNMSNEIMAEAVKIIDGRAVVEASGSMGSKDLRAVAFTGVDIISIGALTHSVAALDVSLRFYEI